MRDEILDRVKGDVREWVRAEVESKLKSEYPAPDFLSCKVFDSPTLPWTVKNIIIVAIEHHQRYLDDISSGKLLSHQFGVVSIEQINHQEVVAGFKYSLEGLPQLPVAPTMEGVLGSVLMTLSGDRRHVTPVDRYAKELQEWEKTAKELIKQEVPVDAIAAFLKSRIY